MLGSHFYHGLTKKYVVLFGSLFNDIYVDRTDANDEVKRTIKIPIQYGPKERYLARYRQNPDLLREISMVFPRMAFEITGITYDPSRKLNTIGKISNINSRSDILTTLYNPVAYNFDITLSIISRNTEDALKIVEQIVPFFTPQWTETLNIIPESNVSIDIPIIIKSVSSVDTYSGNFEDKEWVLWDLTFTLKGYLYGPTKTASVIKQSIVNAHIPDGNIGLPQLDGTFLNELDNPDAVITTTVTPGMLANGYPTSNASLTVPASQIFANNNYGFIIDFQEDLYNG